MQSQINLKDWAIRLISPPEDQVHDELQYWQERVLYSFLLLSVVLGFIVLIPSVLLSIKEELWGVAVLDAVIYIWTAFLFIYRSAPYRIRVYSVILLSYALGIELLIVIGPFGGGPVWLFFFPVITGLLRRLKHAMIAQLINTLTVIIFGWLVYNGQYEWSFLRVHTLESWIVMSLNFLLLSTIATLSIIIVVQGLQSSLMEKKLVLDSLESNNAQLITANQRLVDEINAKNEAEENLHKSEEALKASEIRFKELVNVLPLGYFLIDSDLILRFLNRKAIDFFGFKPDHLNTRMGWQSLTMLATRDRQKALENILQTFEGKETGWTHFTALSENLKEFPVEIYASAIFKEQQIVGVQGLIVNISDRLEKEKLRNEKEIAIKANKAISNWVNFIAHEIRTPISGLLSYSKMGLSKLEGNKEIPAYSHVQQLLSQYSQSLPTSLNEPDTENEHNNIPTPEKEEKLGKYFGRILYSSNRLKKLVDELLDLSKLESGQMQFIMDKANVHAIVEEAAFEMEAVMLEKNIHFTLEDPDLETIVECDSFRIGQLVRNLLSNAIKFTPNGKRISLTYQSSEIRRGRRSYDPSVPALKVSVADEGIGIPKDQLSFIFEKFKQSRKSRKGEGTGLGLPICREIVSAHSGTIGVDSTENMGSCFYFVLPYQQVREF